MLLTRDHLIQFLDEELDIPVTRVGDQDPLFSSGILDSIKLLSLVSFVEKRMHRKVRTAELTLANFDSIQRVINFANA